MIGSILFYNLDTGDGLIIAQNKDKFKIDKWDDFENIQIIKKQKKQLETNTKVYGK